MGLSLPQRRLRDYLCRDKCTSPELDARKAHQGVTGTELNNAYPIQEDVSKGGDGNTMNVCIVHG